MARKNNPVRRIASNRLFSDRAFKVTKRNPIIMQAKIKPHLDPRLGVVGAGSRDLVPRDPVMRNPKVAAPSKKTRVVVDAMLQYMAAYPEQKWHPSSFTYTMRGYRGNIAPAVRWLKTMDLIKIAGKNVENTNLYAPSASFYNAIMQKRMANPQRKTCTSTRRPIMAKRKNPNRRTPLTKAQAIPKGKTAGQHFTKGGKRYVVISYIHPTTRKRVRFARRVKAARRR